MYPDSPTEKRPAPSLDDAYWEALFAQEDALLAAPEPEVATLPIGEQNGRPPSLNRVSATPANKAQWQAAQAVYESDQAIELEAAGYNKGGLLVYWDGLQGFIPASQLRDFPQFHLETERIQALKERLNKPIKLKIIELDPQNNRLIFSERASLVKAEQRERLFGQILPGDQLDGRITNLTKFGAFVDLGGVEGLIHISELSWSRVAHPSEIVQPGQPITVLALKVDQRNNRIALSLKRLNPDPWHNVEKRYQSGQSVTGIVSNIVNYGAFVQLEDELEGLIHISELAEGAFLHPRDILQKGQEVVALILSVNGKAKRLALSLRQNKNP